MTMNVQKVLKLRSLLSSSSSLSVRFKSEETRNTNTAIKYVQGQHATGYLKDKAVKTREYFYYIDHLGQLFLDDTKIKNFTTSFKSSLRICSQILPTFLDTFFLKLRLNNEAENRGSLISPKDFPYVSMCGRERNYIRCDDLPLVVSHFDQKSDIMHLNHIRTDDWAIKFDPTRLYHNSETGRLYYLFDSKRIDDHSDDHDQDTDVLGRKRTTITKMKPSRGSRFVNLPMNVALVASTISIDLMRNAVFDEDDKSGNHSLKFNYKSREYHLSEETAAKASQVVKQFSMLKLK